MGRLHEGSARQLLDLALWQWRLRPIDPGEIAMHREASCLELIAQAANLAIGKLGFDQPIQPGFRLNRPPAALR